MKENHGHSEEDKIRGKNIPHSLPPPPPPPKKKKLEEFWRLVVWQKNPIVGKVLLSCS